MNAFRDAKTMAKILRNQLEGHDLRLSHSQCLEIVARQLGHTDWNTAAAANTRGAMTPMQLSLGWQVAGAKAMDYAIRIDPDRTGAPVAIRSLDDTGTRQGFFALLRSDDIGRFRGERLCLSADLSCAHASGQVSLWMRIDGAAGRNIRFDDVARRSTEGALSETQGWVWREIVLDVPEQAETIHYGIYLRGEGQCWARGFDVRPVARTVPVTSGGLTALKQVMNLDHMERSLTV